MNEDFQMDMVHMLEQGETALANFAKMIGTYHKQLKEEGFSYEQAFEMVRDYQVEALRNMFRQQQ